MHSIDILPLDSEQLFPIHGSRQSHVQPSDGSSSIVVPLLEQSNSA